LIDNADCNRYETSDGTTVQESGVQKQVGENIAIVSKGTYSYVTMDGFRITVNWIADENGFQPTIHQTPIQNQLHG